MAHIDGVVSKGKFWPEDTGTMISHNTEKTVPTFDSSMRDLYILS